MTYYGLLCGVYYKGIQKHLFLKRFGELVQNTISSVPREGNEWKISKIF